MENNTSVFTNRAKYYVNGRPDYPKEIIFELEKHGLTNNSVIADIGSGTGKLTRLFIENGNKTFAVEPNDDMRLIADEIFKNNSNYNSIKGTGENTTLEDSSIDFIAVGQAFNWFDREKALAEFKRLLKNNGIIMMVWNKAKNTEFLQEYEKAINKYPPDDKMEFDSKIKNDKSNKEYIEKNFKKVTIEHRHKLDFDGLLNMYLSQAGVLNEGSNDFFKLKEELRAIFQKYKDNSDKICFDYDAEIYIGKNDWRLNDGNKK